MIEFKITKSGKKTFAKEVNGHKLNVYEINGKFSIRIDNEHVIYLPFEKVEDKLKEYCEKLHYVDVEKFIEFEKNNSSKNTKHFRMDSQDNKIFMSVHVDGEEYHAMVKATDRKTGDKKQRQVAPKVYDYNEAVSIVQSKINEYDTFGYFTRHDMTVKKGTEFVEEKLKEEINSDLEEDYITVSSKEEKEFLLKQQEIFKNLKGE
jgi:hypothetical protein